VDDAPLVAVATGGVDPVAGHAVARADLAGTAIADGGSSFL
jgi:hypothetical protein